MRTPRARIGVFGIGLAAYWPQFPGLKQRLEGYQREVESRIAAEVVSAGLVDAPQAAADAGRLFAESDLDLIVCYVGTYATSSQVLPAVHRAKTPVLILNLQPCEALDYENTDTAEWLANCSTCCVPEISNAFTRCRILVRIISGMLFSEEPWQELAQWTQAASAARALRSSRIGFLGHTYPGMLDMYSDFTTIHAQTGAHVEVLEMCDLAARVPEPFEAVVEEKLEEARASFVIAPTVAEDALRWSGQVAVALDRLVADFDLNGLTYYYRGLAGNEYEQLGAGLILGNSLLTARGIPASGEGDLKTCIAMLLMDRIGAGGSYTEFYAMDFKDNFVLMGHDGPGHIAISDEKPILRGLDLYHGKRGSGVSVEFKVKTGPITLLGVTQTAEGNLKMLTAQGESIPGATLKIGNTNSRLRFPFPPAEFVNRWCAEGPTHHCALGVGRVGRILYKCGELLQIPVVEVI